MRKKLKSLAVVLPIVFLIVTAANYMGNRAAQSDNIAPSSWTKEDYLDEIKKRGGGAYENCFYNKLIDKIGVQATYRFDSLATANPTNTDKWLTPEVKDAMNQCAEMEL